MRSGRDGGEDTSPREAEQGAGQPGIPYTKKKSIAFPTKTIFLTSFLFCRTECRDRLAIVSLKIGSVFPSWPPATFWKKKQRPARPPFPLSPSPEKQFRPLSPFPFDDGFWMDSPPRKNHETGGKKGGGLLAL